jgi:hypothetical protein
MKQLSHSLRREPVRQGRTSRSEVRRTGVALLLAAVAAACSEGSPTTTPVPTAGTGGQATAGSSAGGIGTAGTTLGGASAGAGAGATAGGNAGAMAGSAGNSGSAGSAGATAGGSSGSGGAGGASDDGWMPLFNGMNLSGWTPSPGAAELFAVSDLDGEGVIHVYPTQSDQSQQPQATLRTNDSFSSYVFHVEYKWGTKRFADRKQSDRDNGICFHICNDATQVWPESLEFQIGSQAWPGDWVVGNVFMLVDKTRAQWPFAMLNGQEVFSENGTKKSIGAPASYYKALAPSQLNVNDDWNVIELTVHGSDDAQYEVNGTVVNRLFELECNEGGVWKPLDHGPIALQAEFAEVYFRNARIKVLP